MKTILLAGLLVLSLAANAALFWQLVAVTAKSAGVSSPATSAASGLAPNPSVIASVTSSNDAGAGKTEDGPMSRARTTLQEGDLPTLVEKLRAAGFSPAMIRAIVVARVQEQFSARRRALLAENGDPPYWKARQSAFFDAKTTSGLRELGREQSDLLKQLLGSDSAGDSGERLIFQRRQFGDLPPAKMDQMQKIVSDYGELRGQIHAAAKGVMLAEDREKLRLLEREQQADLAALLTPQELENLELRSSPTASNLRSQLALFDPTEEEFRALFKLQRAFDEKYGSPGTAMNPEQNRLRQAAQKELIEQATTVLTPERMEAYRLSIDPAAQAISRLVARLELPTSAATQVLTVQRDITQRANAVRADKTLAPEVRNMQLNSLAQEANTRLTTALGPRGLEAYQQNGGQWVPSLASRPPQ